MFKKQLTLALVMLSIVFSAIADSDIEINYTEYQLDNGLRLIVHVDKKAPIAAINIWYHVGSKNEKLGKTGFAHLFEHLMFNGSENYNDEFFKPFERVGATNMNGTTYFDRTNYFENVPNTALDMALWMESDRMGHMLGAVTQERLNEQRGVVQNEKRQGDNQPYGLVEYHILEGVFPKSHPYSWSTIGSMEDLNAASLEDVHKWFKTYYGPNNAVIVIAGSVNPEEIFQKVNKYFGDIKSNPMVSKIIEQPVTLEHNKREIIHDRVPQSRIYKAWGTNKFQSEDSVFMQLIDTILTQGKTSRLFNRLVYRDQIATSVNSYLFSGDIAGFYYIQASAQPGGNLENVEDAMNEELLNFFIEGPTEKELDRAKTLIKSRFIRGLEKVGGFGGKSDILAQNAIYANDPGYYKTTLKQLEDASIDDIKKSAKKWLATGSYNLEVHPVPKLTASSISADRTKLPTTENFPEIDFVDFETTILDSGLKLMVATQESVPIVNFNLIINAGYASDQFGHPGTSSLAVAMLDEGTKKRTALEISDEAAGLGAIINASAGIDSSTVSLNTLKENLDESLDLYTDIILNPSFPHQELERLRKQRIAQIQQEKNQPFGMALRLLPKLLYGKNHAYSLPLTGSGTEESVKKISRESLINHHKIWFKPNNSTMIIVGDITMREAKFKLERLLKKWKKGEIPIKNIGEAKKEQNETMFLVDRPGAQQSIVLAANIAPAKNQKNEIAIESMNEIIGGSFTSRVNMNLREDKGWAYGARTLILETKGPRLFIGYAPVQTNKTAESIIELKRELVEYLGENPASNEELEKIKDNNTLSLPGRWETIASIARDISQISIYDLPDDYWKNYADNVRNLSLDHVIAVANNVIKPNNLTWVIVGDLKKIEENVRNLEIGQIIILDSDGNEITTKDNN